MQARYTILERLGGGGQAEVFRGVAESMQGFKKPVAIKRVLPHLSTNPVFAAMFLDEARLSLFLQHANVVQVFDISRAADETFFLVMEFVDGCDLKALIERQTLRKRRFDTALAIYLIVECCKALHYAHALEHPETGEPLGIVHRDISPPNIMVSKNGEVKVVDFGLAKASSQVEITDQGVVKGKFAYLSPEAASGLVVDHRTDIFALGILLWEMLTGRRLFYADTPYDTVAMVREARVPSITAERPDIDVELDEIVRKALAKNPDDRYQDAADLGDALNQFLFSREMKVTSRDLATLVRETRADLERQASPKDSLIEAVVGDELARMTAAIAEELATSPPPPTVRAASEETVDLHDWVAELGLDRDER
jgi:serine/threonine protein kinase